MDYLVEDTAVYPLLIQVAAALEVEIRNSELPPTCFTGLLPGANVARDYCSCGGAGCGMAWVRLVGLTPNDEAPRAASGRSNCGMPMDVIIEVGLERCAPMPGDDGTLPTEREQFEAVRLQMADMAAMRRVLECGFPMLSVRVGGYLPSGPAGGCVGGTMTAIFGGV